MSSILKPHIASAWCVVRRSLAKTNKVCMFTAFIRLSDKDLIFMPPIGISSTESYARLISVAAQEIDCDIVIMAYEGAFMRADEVPMSLAVVQWKTRDGEEGYEFREILNTGKKRVIGPVTELPIERLGFRRFFEKVFKPTLH